MKTKILAIVVIITILSTFPVSAAMTFSDVKSTDWFYTNVNTLVDKGIINGFSNGTFRPNDTMTADQFIKTMVVAMGYTFANGKSYWAQPYIDKALTLGIIKSGEFNTYTKAITRADMCRISVRVVESLEGKKTYKYDTISNTALLTSINDVFNFNEKDKEPISNAYELGILGGYPDGEFKAYKSLSRSEACTVITRVIDPSKRLVLSLSTTATWKTKVVNGWTVPVDENIIIVEYADPTIPTQAEISLTIILGKLGVTLNEQYIAAEQALTSKYSKAVVDQVMNYVKLKTSTPYNLELKMFDVDDKSIWVEGAAYSGISIQLYKKGTY